MEAAGFSLCACLLVSEQTQADLELLSAAFTAVGGENRFKPDSERRLSGCIRSLKLKNAFSQIGSDPLGSIEAERSLAESLTVSKKNPRFL